MAISRRTVLGSAGAAVMSNVLSARAEMPSKENEMTETLKTAASINTAKNAPLPFAMTTPVRVARVGLKARDAESLAEYYSDVVGLREMARRGASIVLGAGDRELMEIEQFSAAKPDDPRSAGLYHTAFLLPTRGDLARWSRRAIDKQLPVAGASDHNVSEAIYLTDPEGNGIEIYSDRPHNTWQWNGDRVKMGTEALDVKTFSMLLIERAVNGAVHRRILSLVTFTCAWAMRKMRKPSGISSWALTLCRPMVTRPCFCPLAAIITTSARMPGRVQVLACAIRIARVLHGLKWKTRVAVTTTSLKTHGAM